MRTRYLSILLAAGLAACGGDDDGHDHDHGAIDAGADPDAITIDAAPRQVVMESASLAPGELVEAIFTGGPSDRAVIRLEAPVAELDWNLHGHAGGGTQTVYEELNRMTVDYTFTPPAQAQWWLLLRNSGPATMAVQVRVELYGNMQWSWQ